jgi:hypothetical protein
MHLVKGRPQTHVYLALRNVYTSAKSHNEFFECTSLKIEHKRNNVKRPAFLLLLATCPKDSINRQKKNRRSKDFVLCGCLIIGKLTFQMLKVYKYIALYKILIS